MYQPFLILFKRVHLFLYMSLSVSNYVSNYVSQVFCRNNETKRKKTFEEDSILTQYLQN